MANVLGNNIQTKIEDLKIEADLMKQCDLFQAQKISSQILLDITKIFKFSNEKQQQDLLEITETLNLPFNENRDKYADHLNKIIGKPKEKENVQQLNNNLNKLRSDTNNVYSEILKKIKVLEDDMTQYQLASFIAREIYIKISKNNCEEESINKTLQGLKKMISEKKQIMSNFIKDKLSKFNENPNIKLEKYLVLINTYMIDNKLKMEIYNEILLEKSYSDLEKLRKKGVNVLGI